MSNHTEEEFLEKMLKSYPVCHNARYWQEIHPYIETKAAGRCLDIGCGPGLLLKDLVNRYHPMKLYGIDLSNVMLDKARVILDDQVKEGKVELIQQHMQEDPNLPANLDVIFSSRVLRSFEDQCTILNAIFNALAPGGRFVLLDWDKKSIREYFEYFKKSGRLDESDIEEVIRLHRNFSKYSIDDWEFLLSRVGFTIELAFQVNEAHICLIAKKNE